MGRVEIKLEAVLSICLEFAGWTKLLGYFVRLKIPLRLESLKTFEEFERLDFKTKRTLYGEMITKEKRG